MASGALSLCVKGLRLDGCCTGMLQSYHASAHVSYTTIFKVYCNQLSLYHLQVGLTTFYWATIQVSNVLVSSVGYS